MTNPVSTAIDLVGLSPLAKACGVTYQAVRKWERLWPTQRVDWRRARQIVLATQGRVTIQDLLPEVATDLGMHPAIEFTPIDVALAA